MIEQMIEIFYPYYISDKGSITGLARDLCTNLDKSRFKPYAFTNENTGIKGVELFRIPTGDFYLKMGLIPFYSIKNYDLIQTGPQYAHLLSRSLEKILTNTKHIHTLWAPPESPNQATRILYKEADCVVAVSEYVANLARKNIGDRDIEVIYNGIPMDTFRPLNLEKEGPPMVLFVGNLVDFQRPQHVYRLAEMMKEVDFVVKGTGPLLNEAKKKARKLENLKIITEWLSVDDLVELYNRADIYFQPSIKEGFGLVTAEAMACETPAIGADITATPEVIGNKDLLFEPDNLEQAEKIIRRLIEDEKLRKKLGKKSRSRIKNNFSFRKMISDYSKLYEVLVIE
ncbi:hypothetical protein AKJ55_01925 [candidate division MSBL1 archaeon SCGC-AAA382M17]|uniref:Glycosyl transferase family 1 domain-containing protein n=1 Tax=candidate division MSBL1 archaeon SCGC-AAA382M17 TaxID=1698284 RepID=A0ABR5TJ41_9EURY|nr:hypothetical protein AKJ55_01925 [candidate division MSBL1 archaeon SCGC-AAA382M17]